MGVFELGPRPRDGRRTRGRDRGERTGQNELANQIELARRQELLIAQKGANERRTATPSTGASLCSGVLLDGYALQIQMESDSSVVFGDGMETTGSPSAGGSV